MSDEGAQHGAAPPEAEWVAVAEEPPAAPPPPPPKERRRRAAGRGGGAVPAALLVLVILAGIAASPWWAPALAPLLPWGGAPGAADEAARQQLAALGQRLAALEQRVGAQKPAPAPDLGPALDPLKAQLAALDRQLAGAAQELTQLRQRPNPESDMAALRDSVQKTAAEEKQLADRIAALEAKLAALPAAHPEALQALQASVAKLSAGLDAVRQEAGRQGGEALFLALGQLRQAMEGSGGFAEELAAALALAKGDGAIEAKLGSLKDAAARGLPSLADLRTRFDAVSGQILDAAGAEAKEGGWVDTILRGLHIRVRQIGTGAASGSGPAAAVAKAEAALAGGDLAAAVAALQDLRGQAALAAKPWLDEARRRLEAEAALAAATNLAATRLAASGGSGAAAAEPDQAAPATPAPKQP
ncbi:MAG TPA: mitofilin family membrane protein [Stellaceae bacterium]|nr:mitofilin family membrane protein [Stellaceae bacterium]